MTVKEVFGLLTKFKDEFDKFRTNEFLHFRDKIENRINWLFCAIIVMLLGIIANLILVIVKIL